jgi:hypothetical protein
MSQDEKQTKKRLKKCIKQLQFYFDAMLSTNLMDDIEDRRNFISIMQELKQLKKETI